MGNWKIFIENERKIDKMRQFWESCVFIYVGEFSNFPNLFHRREYKKLNVIEYM